MKHKPFIVVRLVQIRGPLRKIMMEFSKDNISIGRAPTCDVRFPPELDIVSKKHAEIVRDGNSFKLIDQSSNGTFVQELLLRGKEKKLTSGDVLTLADLKEGPKIAFSTEEVTERRVIGHQPEYEVGTDPGNSENGSVREYARSDTESNKTEEPEIKSVSIPFRIIHGINFKSFETLPIIIGRNRSDFPLDHPQMLDHHAQIFFNEDRYWIKDLTGKKMVSVNEQPADTVPLHVDDRVSLSPQGPRFRFLEGGCLQSVEAAFQKDEVSINSEKERHSERVREEENKKNWLSGLFSR